MRKGLFFITLWLTLGSVIFPVALAQEAPTNEGSSLIAVISGDKDTAVGRPIILNASSSRGLGENTAYAWYIGDDTTPVSTDVDMIYTPVDPGDIVIRLTIQTTIDGRIETSEIEQTVTAYLRKFVLIADTIVDEEKLQAHKDFAAENGIFMRILQPAGTSIPLSAEEQLTNVISENASAFSNAETIVIWTDGISGLNALMRAFEGDIARLEAVKNQTLVLISDRSLGTLSRAARGPFTVLEPLQILLTRKDAIRDLSLTPNISEFIKTLRLEDIELETVDQSSVAVRPWNLLSSLVTFMITRGVSSQIVILLLILPVIATIVSFLKQVIGITTFGLYTPSILALSFLALGWGVGFFFLVSILVIGYLTRSAMKRWRILYIPKVAIILSVVSISLLVLLAIASRMDILFGKDTVFILLIMSTLAESLLNVRTEEGWKSALLGIGETVLAAMLCVVIVQWSVLQSIIIAYPECILLTIVINIVIGRFTGLRFLEYLRFREVIKHIQEE